MTPSKINPATDPRPIRAAAYVRVSTVDQAREGFSLGEQQRRVRAYAESKGWELGEKAVYVEAGVSGRRDDRPELARILSGLDEIDVLIVPALSRLGRSNRHLQETFATLADADVELVSIAESIDTSTAAGKLLRNVLAALAEFEADLLGERVAGSTLASRRNGNAPGGRAPYGYRRGEKGGEWLIDPPTAVIVKRIYDECLAGLSRRSTLRGLEADRIPGPTGKGWSERTVARILDSPVYLGHLTLKGEVVQEDAHEATIDAESWQRAKALRAERDRGRGSNRGRRPKGGHLFTRGTLRCGRCGEAMIARSHPRQGSLYICRSHLATGDAGCTQRPVPASGIDGQAWEFFTGWGLDLDRTRRDFEARRQLRLTEARELLESAEREVVRLDAEVGRITAAFRSGDLSAPRFEPMVQEAEVEARATREEADRLRARKAEVEGEASGRDAEADFLAAMAKLENVAAGQVRDATTTEAQRAAILTLFNHFTYYEVDHLEAIAAEALGASSDPSKGLPGFVVGSFNEDVALDSKAAISLPDRTVPTAEKISRTTCGSR